MQGTKSPLETARQFHLNHGTPALEQPVAVVSRALCDENGLVYDPKTGAFTGQRVDRGLAMKKRTVTAMTVTATIAAAAIIGGIITANQGAAGTATYTTCTGTQLETALTALGVTLAVGDAIQFSIVNISTNSAEIVTVAGGTGMTMKGNVTVAANNSTTTISRARFEAVRTAANTWDVYRIA